MIEIMAPAGNYESLAAAIKAGANSVYFGVEQLNMRARAANNFKLDDLSKIISICKRSNTKTYLTVNTIMFCFLTSSQINCICCNVNSLASTITSANLE